MYYEGIKYVKDKFYHLTLYNTNYIFHWLLIIIGKDARPG